MPHSQRDVGPAITGAARETRRQTDGASLGVLRQNPLPPSSSPGVRKRWGLLGFGEQTQRALSFGSAEAVDLV
jgi:hypothetical protein